MKKSDGFGVIGVVIIVAALVVAGFVGWRVWDATRGKQGNSNQTGRTPSTQEQNNTPTDTTTYLDIKELGVKIKLSEDIKDAVYYYDAAYNAEYPNPQQVTLSSQSLASKSNGTCKAASGIGPLGTVQKYTSSVDGLGNKIVANGSTVIEIENTFLLLKTPQSACSLDSAVEALAQSQRAAFREAFKTIQADK